MKKTSSIEKNDCILVLDTGHYFHGKGYGYRALAEALENVNFGHFFFANVQIDNLPSQKLFEKLDFIEASRDSKFILFKKNNYS